MSELAALKLIGAVVVFGFGLVGGMLPWRLAHVRRSETVLGWGNAFAGGVLLAAGLIHLLGDAAGAFPTLWPEVDYPWAFTIAAAAFLGLLGLERVLPRLPASKRTAVATSPAGGSATEDVRAEGDPEAAAIAGAVEHSATLTAAYLLLMALSIHSVLAGLALGAQTQTAGFVVVLVAIVAHKSSAAFALGVNLFRAGLTLRRALWLIVVFATMTPIGILLGTAITAALDARGEQVFEAVFDAIAAGTFLYIASLDIIREEFVPPPRDRGTKYAWACLGATIMAVVAIWT